MKRDQAVDFFLVEDKHLSIHKRLENWARWSWGGGGGSSASPMFRLYRSTVDETLRQDLSHVSLPMDPLDAAAIQKGVSHLPDSQRHAINWNYLRPSNPKRESARLGVTLEGLSLLVRSARVMLINRGC